MAHNFNTIEGTEVILVNDDIQGSHQITIDDIKNYINGGKRIYKALLLQDGADNPYSIVLENTLGYNIEFKYDNVGSYTSSSIVENELNLNLDKILVTITTPVDANNQVASLVIGSMFKDILWVNSYIYDASANHLILANDVISSPDNNNKTTIIIEIYP